MPPLDACTIASNNYLAMARVFAESYLRHHPGARVFACVVDEPSSEVAYDSLPFTSVFARDLGLPAFRNMAFRYDVTELNTAVKPTFLAHLRDRFALDRVLYFDPDVVVYDRLEGLERQLRESPMVLTPHITQPLEQGGSPSERLINQVGVYNLGFLGLRLDESTRGFLDWWQRRLYRLCLHDLPNGLFVDQSWMDLAPAFVEGAHVTREPIYNVAYWNLPQRFPRQLDGSWTVEGSPMAFFHFSGLDLEDLDGVSRHQNRFRLRDRPELRPLFEDYRRRLLDAGFLEGSRVPYAYDRFQGGGASIPRYLRRALGRVDPNGVRWPDPFTTEGRRTFFAWLEEADGYALGWLPRGALCLWEERLDLRISYPDVTGRDLPDYVHWLRTGGGLTAGLWPSLLERATSRGPSPVHRPSLPVGNWPGAPKELSTLDLSRPGRNQAWLSQPAPGLGKRKPRLNAASLLLHAMRPDAQAAFPDPRGADQSRFAHWFVFHGSQETGLDDRLVEPVARTLPAHQRLKYWLSRRRRAAPPAPAGSAVRRPATELAPSAGDAERSAFGVNLAGYFEMDTGVGQAARGSLAALEWAGIPVARVPLRPTVAEWDTPEPPPGAPYQISLVHANADQSPVALTALPAAAAAGSFRVGYWFWELAHFPLVFADRFRHFDEIWAPSEFCAASFRTLSDVPVRHVPPCVPPPEPRMADRLALGLEPDRFYFFYSFDVASVPERKNPHAAIEALRRLQALTSRRVGLVLKVMRAGLNRDLLTAIRDAASGLPVVFWSEQGSRDDLETLLSACDACLSLHRSEGLGLLPIESMYLRKPVVATGYGGVTDYLDETTGFPVGYRMRRVGAGNAPYPEGAAWADPDLDSAAEQMRRVVEEPALAATRAEAAHRRVLGLYSVEAAGERLAREVARLGGPPLPVAGARPPRPASGAPVPGERLSPMERVS
jgi:glycosyltransferase involved in cell wall biosynthesis